MLVLWLYETSRSPEESSGGVKIPGRVTLERCIFILHKWRKYRYNYCICAKLGLLGRESRSARFGGDENPVQEVAVQEIGIHIVVLPVDFR